MLCTQLALCNSQTLNHWTQLASPVLSCQSWWSVWWSIFS